MALSPLNPQFYDHLGAWLGAQTWKHSLVLSITGWVAFLSFVATAPHNLTVDATPAYVALALGVYVPATVMVLLPRKARSSGHGVGKSA